MMLEVKLEGLEKVEATLAELKKCTGALLNTVSDVSMAISDLQIADGQPPEKTGD